MLFQLRTACVISKLYYNSQYNAKLMQNLKKVGRLGRAKTCPMDQPKRQGFLGQFYFQDGILTCIILKADWGTTTS